MNETTETQAADKEPTETQQRLEEIERVQTQLQEQLSQVQAAQKSGDEQTAAGAMLPTRSKADKISPTHKRLQSAAIAAAKNPNRAELMHYMKIKRNRI
jgi:hypothetical protein